MIPSSRPPVTRLGGSGSPITLPRRASKRGRTFSRATGLGRTGTNAGPTFMHRRWRLGGLFLHHRIPRGTRFRAGFNIGVFLRERGGVLHVQRIGKLQNVLRGNPVPVRRQRPIRIGIHCRRVISTRKWSKALPKVNRIFLFSIWAAHRVRRWHQNMRGLCTTRAEANLCFLGKHIRIMATSAIARNAKENKLVAIAYI